jgi:hypothetical protein
MSLMCGMALGGRVLMSRTGRSEPGRTCSRQLRVRGDSCPGNMPSGRINPAGGAAISPKTGSSHTPSCLASTNRTRFTQGEMSKPPGSRRLRCTGRASCSTVKTREANGTPCSSTPRDTCLAAYPAPRHRGTRRRYDHSRTWRSRPAPTEQNPHGSEPETCAHDDERRCRRSLGTEAFALRKSAYAASGNRFA